jgi:hypothetical protein
LKAFRERDYPVGALAHNLIKAGHSLKVYDVSGEAANFVVKKPPSRLFSKLACLVTRQDSKCADVQFYREPTCFRGEQKCLSISCYPAGRPGVIFCTLVRKSAVKKF